MIKAEKQDLEAMRRAALKFRNVGLSRALTTWAAGAPSVRCTNRTPSCSRRTTPASSPRRFTPRTLIHTAQFLVRGVPAFASSSSSCSSRGARAVKSNHRLRDNVVESLRLTRSKHALRHLRLGIEASKEQGRKLLRADHLGPRLRLRAALVKG